MEVGDGTAAAAALQLACAAPSRTEVAPIRVACPIHPTKCRFRPADASSTRTRLRVKVLFLRPFFLVNRLNNPISSQCFLNPHLMIITPEPHTNFLT